MDYAAIKRLGKKLCFTVEDAALAMGIKSASARVMCSRYVKKGLFVRIKNNFYVLDQNWEHYSNEDLMKLSNHLQVPSYISFMTALQFYEITTQVTRGVVESASVKRSAKFSVKTVEFNYIRMKREYYTGFVKKNGVFIATAEKAFVDSVYLHSIGKYRLDTSALCAGKLDQAMVRKLLRDFPKKTKGLAETLCKN